MKTAARAGIWVLSAVLIGWFAGDIFAQTTSNDESGDRPSKFDRQLISETTESKPPNSSATPDGVRPSASRGPVSEHSGASSRTVVVPTIEILQRVPPEIRPNQAAPVEITIRNAGAVAVEKAIVTKLLGPHVELLEGVPAPSQHDGTLIWSLGRLEPGQRKAIHLSVRVRDAAGSPVLEHAAEVAVTTNVTSVTRIAAARLSLEVDSPKTATVGVPVKFSISVSNVGNAPASNVVVHDRLPDGLVHPYGANLESEIGQLEPGERRTLDLTVTPMRVGEIMNVIRVVADELEPVQHRAVLVAEMVQLAVEAVAPKTRFLNRPITYQFVITNRGTTEARDVRLQATLPGGVAFSSASDGGEHDAALHTVSWAIGSVKTGQTRHVSLTGAATQIGENACRVVLTAAGAANVESQCMTMVRGVPALRMEVVDLADPIEVGAETTYEIRIANQGSTPTTNVRIQAEFPSELEPTGAEGPTPHTIADHVLTFAPLSSLEPNAQVTLRVKANGKKSGECRCKVTLNAEEFSRPIVEEESTTVFGDE